VSLAENGRIALERLRTEPFDLLLLDIEMPELDGFAVPSSSRPIHSCVKCGSSSPRPSRGWIILSAGAGYTGTEQLATYTCIGDTVNLAARLEAHTKVTGYGILIDDATQRALNGNVPMQSLGEVPFKGKAAAVEIFAVMSGQQHGQT